MGDFWRGHDKDEAKSVVALPIFPLRCVFYVWNLEELSRGDSIDVLAVRNASSICAADQQYTHVASRSRGNPHPAEVHQPGVCGNLPFRPVGLQR